MNEKKSQVSGRLLYEEQLVSEMEETEEKLKKIYNIAPVSVKIIIDIDEELENVYSDFQKIRILRNESFGKILFLDHELQFSELDEFVYHEMFSFPALFSHKDPKRVLIIGGGDLLLAKQILKYPAIQTVDLVELDGKVVEICKKHFVSINETSKNPKLNIFIEDGRTFVENCQQKYDLIFLDLPDDKKNCEPIFSEKFYNDVSENLENDGIIAIQMGVGGSFCHNEGKMRKINNFQMSNPSFKYISMLKKYFKYMHYYTQYVPSFFASWSFLLGSRTVDFKNYNQEFSEQKYQTLTRPTEYYTPQLHLSLLNQPKIIEELQKGTHL